MAEKKSNIEKDKPAASELKAAEPKGTATDPIPLTQEEPKKNKKKAWLIVLVVLLLTLIGCGVWWYLRAHTKKPAPAPTVSQTQQSTVPVDPLANWISYTAIYEGATFKYPPDWKLEKLDLTQRFRDYGADWKGPFEAIRLTSPSGFVLRLDSHISGIGGGCDPETCPWNNVLSVQQVSKLKNGNPIYLVKLEIKDSTDTTVEQRTIGLYAPMTAEQKTLQPGIYKGFPPYILFPSQGVDGALAGFAGPRSIVSGEPPSTVNYQSNLTGEQYFAQPDLETAGQILSTISF